MRWSAVPRLTVMAACALALASAQAQKTPSLSPRPLPADVSPQVHPSQCGGYTGIYGPFDFRSVHPDDRRVVEAYHLDMEMQIFLSGRVEGTHRAGSGPIAGGFVYVLRSMPNHPAALLMIEQLGRKLKSERPQRLEWPLECFYLRAFMLVPDDLLVRGMYGIYLAYRGRTDEAAYNLDLAEVQMRRNGALQYQMGLANLALKRYEKAQLNAMRAAKAGFTQPGLREHLSTAGKWQESLSLPPDPPDPQDAPDSTATAASAPPAADTAASAAPAR